MTRMQSSSRAPVLSATRTRVSCWIMPPDLSGLLQHLDEAPVLRLGQRARLDDAHGVPHARGVRLVARVELRRPADDLLLLPVPLDRPVHDDDRLVHRRGDDDAAALLAAAALAVGLRQPDDGLALRRLLAHDRRAPAAPGAGGGRWRW